MSFKFYTNNEILKKIASQAKQIRLDMNLSQEGLAQRSGLSLSSLKRFEQTGKISLESLVKLAMVLNAEEDLLRLFTAKINPGMSLDEILETPSLRKRGRKK
jgi:transcriptional regulator with XRE-family HTH domain